MPPKCYNKDRAQQGEGNETRMKNSNRIVRREEGGRKRAAKGPAAYALRKVRGSRGTRVPTK